MDKDYKLIEEKNKLYRTFIEQSSEGIWRAEFDKPIPVNLPAKEQLKLFYKYEYIADCNPAMVKMYGLKNKEDLIGKKLIEIHGSDDNPQNIIAQIKFINSGYKIIDVETHEINFEGKIVYFLNNCTGIIENEHLIAIWGSQRDITKQKQYEKKLEKLNFNLEMKVDKRTAELKRSNSELEQFAYAASHDLQEPLRMISSYLQLLEKRYSKKLDKDAKEFIEYAVDGSNRMQFLINDLLQYSRIDRKNNNIEDVDLNVILIEVKKNLRNIISDNKVKIKTDKLPVIRINKTQILRVFQNLIENSIKFRKDEVTPEIKITYKKNKNEYIFSFKDNGIGMEKDEIARIFYIFHRLHRNKKYAGSGIGLSVCKKIIENNNGKLWANSEIGKGSEFCFRLPFKGKKSEKK